MPFDAEFQAEVERSQKSAARLLESLSQKLRIDPAVRQAAQFVKRRPIGEVAGEVPARTSAVPAVSSHGGNRGCDRRRIRARPRCAQTLETDCRLPHHLACERAAAIAFSASGPITSYPASLGCRPSHVSSLRSIPFSSSMAGQ